MNNKESHPVANSQPSRAIAGTQPKPLDICQGSLHKMDGRIVLCRHMEWSQHNLTKVVLYEFSTDKDNEVSYEELVKMIEDKTFELHTPQKGRKLPWK